MLSQAAIEYLSPLTFRANAERRSCLLPLGGIYWDDEIPDFKSMLKLSEHDRDLIYRLFSIRFKIWDDTELSEDEHCYWDEARLQVPNYALFHRLELSAEEQRAQDAVERNAIEGFQVLFAGAKEIKITENVHGISSFTATFDVTKDNAK